MVVGTCVLVPTEVLQPINNNAIYCPYEGDITGEHEYCDGEIPPLTNIVIGDIDGSCSCLQDENEDISLHNQLDLRSIEDLHGDYKQYYDGNDLRVILEKDNQVKSIYVSTVSGQLIKRVQTMKDVFEYSFNIPSQRQIYVVQYIYEDSMESALIPIL